MMVANKYSRIKSGTVDITSCLYIIFTQNVVSSARLSFSQGNQPQGFKPCFLHIDSYIDCTQTKALKSYFGS
jgi:hypothetical protein